MNTEKIDRAVLALLYLNATDEGTYAWKSFDWDAMERLYAKGFISNPVTKAKSVTFTELGWEQAQHAFDDLFSDD